MIICFDRELYIDQHTGHAFEIASIPAPLDLKFHTPQGYHSILDAQVLLRRLLRTSLYPNMLNTGVHHPHTPIAGLGKQTESKQAVSCA